MMNLPSRVGEHRPADAGRSKVNAAVFDLSAGTLEDWLGKDESLARVVIKEKKAAGAQHTLTHYQVRARHGGLMLLELRPQTGRKHQLRVQLASRGYPIYGDKKYGSKHLFGPAIALHARSLTFLHPVRQEPITLTAELPNYWRGRFAYLLKEVGL